MRGFLECCGYRPSDVTPLDELMTDIDPEDALAHVATEVNYMDALDQLELEEFFAFWDGEDYDND